MACGRGCGCGWVVWVGGFAVTEPVPLLAEEPLKVEPAAAELALLAKAVDKAGKAVRVSSGLQFGFHVFQH
eukprot:162988-Pelagomonas_calceolata.AAC.2